MIVNLGIQKGDLLPTWAPTIFDIAGGPRGCAEDSEYTRRDV